MALDRKDKLAAGVLWLFALPFAAVGVVASYWVVSTLASWQRMANWVGVPADLVSLDLRSHGSSDHATTYKVVAQYRYRFDGRDYTGDRVAISDFSDNIGSFHRDLYAQLRAAQRRHQPVTVYVDPQQPASAVLNRDPRWPLLAFQSLFALIFGGVGGGLMYGAIVGGKKVAAQRELQRRYPNEPWRWRPEWSNPRIESSSRATAYGATVFAMLWNAVSAPVLMFLPDELAKGNRAALIGLVFPLAGIGLAVWAVRAWLRLRRFGTSALALERVPIGLGGGWRGSIRVPARVELDGEFHLDLSCVERYRSGTGRNRSTSERILWQNEWTVPRSRCAFAAGITTIPVEIAVPAEQPATSVDDGDRITWRLDVSAVCPGPDYWSRFALPVFDLGERAPLFGDAEDTPMTAVGAGSAATAALEPRTLAALGIVCQREPSGRETWTFRRARDKSVALSLTAITAIWSAISIGLFWTDAPLLFPLAFGAFDLVFVWWTLTLWLTEYRVALDDRTLKLSRRGFAAARPHELPRAFVRKVRVARGMQAGSKLYYDLKGTRPTAASRPPPRSPIAPLLTGSPPTSQPSPSTAPTRKRRPTCRGIRSHASRDETTPNRGLSRAAFRSAARHLDPVSAQVPRRIGNAGRHEPLAPQPARVASTARTPLLVRAVAGHRERVIDAELDAAADDLRLRERHERRVDRDRRTLHAALRRQPRERLERRDELGTTIRIARIVDRVHADDDPIGFEHLGPREREREEHRVARRHVGRRYSRAAVLRHFDRRIRERRAAELADRQPQDAVLHRAERPRDLRGGGKLRTVPLPVVERERVAVEPR